jgi:hypothetical protein
VPKISKATGSNKPMTGAGSRGTGRAKVTKTAGKVKTVSRKSIMTVKSNPTRGMDSPTRNIKRT